MSNNKLHAIGIMSGTSLDGIDISYVSSDGKSRFTHNCSSLFKFRDSTRESLYSLVNNFTKNKNSISNINDCENLVSEDYVNAIRKFIKSKNIKNLELFFKEHNCKAVIVRPDRFILSSCTSVKNFNSYLNKNLSLLA